MINWKGFFFRLKIFAWYLVTEPLRQLRTFIYLIGELLDHTTSWVFIFLFVSILALVVGKKPVASILLFTLLLAMLLWEWRSGEFIHRYRQKVKKRIEKTLKEKEGKLVKDRRD